MNATLDTSPQPVQPTPDSSTYPPALSDTIRELVHELLRTVKPGLDVQATWLAYRDSRLPPDAENNIHSAPLIDSLIEHFTGRLSWEDHEVQGFYPTPSASAQAPVIEPLGRTAILDLYAGVRQQLEPLHSRKLSDYWAFTRPEGGTRRSEFLAERIRCLKSECEIQISLGKMTTRHFTMLSAALKSCVDSAVDELQPHSVYSVSASVDNGEPVALSGAFAITRRFRTQPVMTDEEELEDILLFTPYDGLEAFASFKQMNDSLIQRGTDSEYRQFLQAQLIQADTSTTTISTLRWHYTALSGNFLSLLMSRQVTEQQSGFARAVQLARAQQMDSAAFEQLYWRLLAPDFHFNNHRRLDQLDAELVYAHMPDWWKNMGQRQREEWREQARRFGEAVMKLQRSSNEYFDRPEIDSQVYLKRYIDQQLSDALNRAGITLEPERIRVSLVSLTSPEVLGIQGAPVTPSVLTTTVPLTQLAHDDAYRKKAEDAVLITVTDDTDTRIKPLNSDSIIELIRVIKNPQHLDNYLDLHLKSSAYAHQLKRLQRDQLESQMRMALLEIEQQAFPLTGTSWIKAVLDGPSPRKRRTVNGEGIEVRFFSVNGLKMTNVMLIAPIDSFDKGPLVLCTLDAPDGVVFRWFNSMYHLKVSFLEEKPFQRYLLQQIPVSRRLEMLHAMSYEKEAKHWRVPDIFTRLSPIPIPERLLRPVIFVSQTKDFYEEGHETKINQLIVEARRRMSLTSDKGLSGQGFNLLTSIAILFLPEPIMMPIALGIGLYKTWSAFSKIEENDLEGAAEEFLSAVDYIAIALVGRLALALRPTTYAVSATRRPHLIRRIGRDGQVQIGYLMSHTNTPRLGGSKLTVAMDSTRFVAIEIENQTCYVSRRTNLFGHSRLYRPSPINASLLVHEQEYALRTTSGAWKAVGKEIPRISPQAIRNARSRLANALTDWPSSFQEASAVERMQFEADYLALSKASNAENLSEIVAYTEGGSPDINPMLRNGIRSTATRRFLDQFCRLKEWHGTAFRATYVTNKGMACLEREVGAVFVDNGVQSASVARANASRWSQDGFVSSNANIENHPVFFIFAPGIPKKNMFTGFLGDHVAIPPGTPMQLAATQRLNGQLFAWFDVPEQLVDHTYDPYSGEQEIWV
ncbi:dermonecrotic toxin domain-containing protein [Pseudomonas cannabina]|uniref:Dermonecrotic toxin N-terminal domain-containing protein n=1 Tax=Pseudomonas cannabina TaxID=86840 RepID=A0A0P9LRE5_PSECA|nr:DUF6543 domain-containing protein [Pseudomonas cannabina]KAA8704938.1 hypothetical protein F4W70_22495 [Pseudomonas cannabina]KPW77829.1 Uncharacterized protein ALO81_03361 [Pseudomonas cannabina]RMN17688.1 hypothetical protein ALQ64_01050 [Pseudomonas cannabina]SDR44995.1 hypothetical protein SAMN05216597_4919 [Pseudomonas cannabina]